MILFLLVPFFGNYVGYFFTLLLIYLGFSVGFSIWHFIRLRKFRKQIREGIRVIKNLISEYSSGRNNNV